jgi:hypothetical protein
VSSSTLETGEQRGGRNNTLRLMEQSSSPLQALILSYLLKRAQASA